MLDSMIRSGNRETQRELTQLLESSMELLSSQGLRHIAAHVVVTIW